MQATILTSMTLVFFLLVLLLTALGGILHRLGKGDDEQ